MNRASLIAQLVKNPSAMQETLAQFLGREDLLERGQGYPLQYSWASLVAQLVKNLPAVQETWVGKIPWRRERLPTPVFWPGEFHGLHSPWGSKESNTTERLSLYNELLGLARYGWAAPGDPQVHLMVLKVFRSLAGASGPSKRQQCRQPPLTRNTHSSQNLSSLCCCCCSQFVFKLFGGTNAFWPFEKTNLAFTLCFRNHKPGKSLHFFQSQYHTNLCLWKGCILYLKENAMILSSLYSYQKTFH